MLFRLHEVGEPKDKSRFRHELKYDIPVSVCNQFFDDCKPFCNWDPHSGPTHAYEIASIYYDTDDFRFYVDRMDSVGYRRKVRLRAYNTDGVTTALFAEIKEKHKHLVNKKRQKLEGLSLLEDSPYPDYRMPLDYVLKYVPEGTTKREIEYLHNRLHLYPVSVIRYIRRALLPIHEPDIRITMDTRISAGGQSLSTYDFGKEKWIINPSHTVLEVKTNRSLPSWLLSAMRRYRFMQVRYSKYCLGVDAVVKTAPAWLQTSEERELITAEDLPVRKVSASAG